MTLSQSFVLKAIFISGDQQKGRTLHIPQRLTENDKSNQIYSQYLFLIPNIQTMKAQSFGHI